jgi:hypothetical protein
MSFRFSMQWLLAATLYAAVAAAAFTQRSWYYADLLWVVTLAVFGYAVLVTCYARGERRAQAAGFVVLSLCYLACLHFEPESVPTQRLLDIFTGSEIIQVVPVQRQVAEPPSEDPFAMDPNIVVPTPRTPPMSQVIPSNPYAGPAQPPMIYAPPVYPIPGAPTVPVQTISMSSLRLRAANAIATLLFGVLGCLLGSLAYRHSPRG